MNDKIEKGPEVNKETTGASTQNMVGTVANALPSIITTAGAISVIRVAKDVICMGGSLALPGAASLIAAVGVQARSGILRGTSGITTKQHLEEAKSSRVEENQQPSGRLEILKPISIVATIDTAVTHGFDTKAVCRLKGEEFSSSHKKMQNTLSCVEKARALVAEAKTHASAVRRLYVPKLGLGVVGAACFLEIAPAMASQMAASSDSDPTLLDYAKAGVVTGGVYGVAMSVPNAVVDHAMYKTQAVLQPDGSTCFNGPGVWDGLKNSEALKVTVKEALAPKKLVARSVVAAATMATLQVAVNMYGKEPITGLPKKLHEFSEHSPKVSRVARGFFSQHHPSSADDNGVRDLPQNPFNP